MAGEYMGEDEDTGDDEACSLSEAWKLGCLGTLHDFITVTSSLADVILDILVTIEFYNLGDEVRLPYPQRQSNFESAVSEDAVEPNLRF